MPKIIQFLHPGTEATPARGATIIPWNCSDEHKRKFMVSKGKYVSENSEKEDCLTFWGEWEPQSLVERLPEMGGAFPKWLNRPFLDNSVNCCHNTDPNVFGEVFRYMICRQSRYPGLRNLEPNSLILFGSCIGGKFCLDTVFVVSVERTPYSKNEIEKLNSGKKDAFYYASLKPLTCIKPCVDLKCDLDNLSHVLYKGVTFSQKEAHNNMFSFSPVRKHKNTGSFMFERPVITIPNIIRDRLNQGINWMQGQEYTVDEIAEVWKSVVNQVEEQNLLLGTQFDNPPMGEFDKLILNDNSLFC